MYLINKFIFIKRKLFYLQRDLGYLMSLIPFLVEYAHYKDKHMALCLVPFSSVSKTVMSPLMFLEVSAVHLLGGALHCQKVFKFESKF